MSAILLAEQQDAKADSALAAEEAHNEDKVVDETAKDDFDAAGAFHIFSYGADYTVDLLVKRLQTKAFVIPPFQREYVWTQPQASRFIESLLLGLPVPGIFVAKEGGTARHLVVDGQQRLKTLKCFFEGCFQGRSFKLQGVDERWRGKTIDELNKDDRQRLDDSIIHTTVFKQEKPDDNASVYFVFERLNTGGAKLYPQEIRSCISPGKFIDLLKDINGNATWRKLFGPKSKRQKDQELILRFLAFLHMREQYERPMREFLNEFTRRHRNLDDSLCSQFKREFFDTVEVAYKALDKRAFRPQSSLNAAVFDSVMVGLAKRLESGQLTDLARLQAAYDNLLQKSSFQDAYSMGTSDVDSVRTRFDMAEKAFQELK